MGVSKKHRQTMLEQTADSACQFVVQTVPANAEGGPDFFVAEGSKTELCESPVEDGTFSGMIFS